jgi:hypothetical protein
MRSCNLNQDRSISMTDEAISPLRRRMIEDMTIRKLAPQTQQGYIRTIKNFAVFLGRSPDTASFEDVRRFQLHLAENGAATSTVNHTVSALRFLFRVTLKRYSIVEHTLFMSRAGCRWCSARKRSRGCSMRQRGSNTRRR